MGRILVWGLLWLPVAIGQPLSGLWDATVRVNGLEVPFRMEFAGSGPAVSGSFFNGDQKVTSTGGQFDGGGLVLDFDYYAARLTAQFAGDKLTGTYRRAAKEYPFEAKRFAPASAAADGVPAIAGLWDVEVESAKGEKAWHLIVKQSGAEVSAAILRVDGDTGALEGAWRDGKFVLSHFDGARPLLLEVMPRADGTLRVVQNGWKELTAVRSAEARAKGLPEPTDPSRHTSVQDPTAPFHFAFPDLSGKMVSNTDERFRGKVVIVAIGGSWCPNCHDEAPFLVELYGKYRAQGLEIVSLSFEAGDQLKNPARLRAFIQKYGIEYPVLVAGEPDEVSEKLPQAVNLNAWPTTFFLGRDGLVRSSHAGFAGKASGEFHRAMRQEVTGLIERLLAENNVSRK
jgi:thiol-disulfide isomerase/thioredoxin